MKLLISSILIFLMLSCKTIEKQYIFVPEYITPIKYSTPLKIKRKKLDNMKHLLQSDNVKDLLFMLKEYERALQERDLIIEYYEKQIELLEKKSKENKEILQKKESK